MNSIREKTIDVLDGMKDGVLERDEALALALLSAMAGESIFLLGLPGVGKSMIARRLKTAFADASAFEYLMSRFSTPDEIFGPVSISSLKDKDKYERVTEGFLPEADVIFLDEIWKAGPAIQNSLLTVLNEKIYLNGNNEMRLPVKGIIAASNELPSKNENLEALWDRFMIRYIVNPISNPKNFKYLLTQRREILFYPSFPPFTNEEYVTIREKSLDVNIPEAIIDCILEIHDKLNKKATSKDPETGEIPEENGIYYISDRRWKKSIGILQTSAFLNGRDEIDESDMLLLYHMLWNDDSAITEVRDIITEAIISMLFKKILDEFKSPKRHTSRKKGKSGYYSPDGFSYLIDCEGSPLVILKTDYEKMRKNPTEYFFASETSEANLIISNGGEFVIKFIKDGVLSINGYNYPLKGEAESELKSGFFDETENKFDSVMNKLYKDIERNIFTSQSEALLSLQSLAKIYRTRFRQMR